MKFIGSEGLGQHFLTTVWLTLPIGIHFHKQGREMFFIPYLSASLAVFLVLSWARKICKHAHRVSRQQEHTQSAGVDASCMFRKAANAWPLPLSSMHSLLAYVFMCMHLSWHFCCVFLNSDHLEFSLVHSCLYTWAMTRLSAAAIALPWGYWVCFWEGDFRKRLKGLYYVEYA